MAQQPPPPQGPAPSDPSPQPGDSKPADPNAAPAATLPSVIVTGSRPSEDFTPPPASLPRVGGEVRDIPQSITIINKSLMQSQGATSLTSAVRNVPGITIGAAEGGQIGNNFNLNGFSARTDLYIDGMRDPAQYYRDTFALEQIEVLMGPSSMLFGRGSTGGVINQVLKQPSLKKAIEVTGAATSNGLVRTTSDINLPAGADQAFRIETMFQEGKATTRNQTEVLDFGLAPSYKLGIGTPTEITLFALLQHNHDHVDYGLPPINNYPADVPINNAYGFSSDRTDQSVVTLGATVEHKFSKDTRLRSQTQFNYVNTDAIETAPHAVGTVSSNGTFTATLNPGPPFSQLFVEQQSHDRNIFDIAVNNQTELTTKFDTGPVGHTLLSGIDLGYESYYNQNYARNGSCNGLPLGAANATTGYVSCTPLLDPTGGSTPSGVPELPTNLATAQAKALGVYANDTLQVGPQVKLVAGLRYDVYDAQVGNSINTLNTPGNTSLAYAEQTTTFTSVRGGVIWQPSDAQSYYLSYSTSFNPSLEQLVSTTGISQPLPPETNEAYEAGAKYDLMKGNLSLTAAAFQITQYNSRSQNSDNTYTANGTVQVKGVRTGIAGRLSDQWQVFGGYTYLDARIIQAVAPGTLGNSPINTPQNAATLWSTYTIAGKYELGGGVTYQGLRYANNTDSVVAPEFYRFDATAAYKQPGYEIRLNVFNLLNTQYYEQLIASDGGRAVPGSGLTAMLTLNYRL